MSKAFVIREYQEKDKDFVIELLRLNTPEFFAPEEEQEFITYLESEIQKYFVLSIQDKIVGCGGINFNEDQTVGTISWDIFHPEYQGQSLGTELLKHRLDLLKNMPEIERVIVRTTQLVFEFYDKNGFELEEIELDYWAPGFDLYYMTLDL